MVTDWQWHYLKRDYNFPTDRMTYREKLPVRDQISCIELEMTAQKWTEDWDDRLIDRITKIEVIGDGSAVLYSCVPETAAFLHLTQIGSVPNFRSVEKAEQYDTYKVKICFGRYQRDEEYLLDTSVYNNVYLEVPFDITPDAWSSGTMSVTMRYLRPIEKLPAKGFIRSRDIEYGEHDWSNLTATGRATWYVDLPLKYPWYLLGCRLYDLETEMTEVFKHVKLDIDDGRYILVDDDVDDVVTTNTERLPYPVHVTHFQHYFSAGSQYCYSWLGETEQAEATETQTVQGINFPISAMTAQKTAFWPVSPAGVATSGTANVSLWGTAYMCCLIIKDWFIQPQHGLEKFNPFPVMEHSEADIEYTVAGYDVEDLRTFLQEVCPPKI